MKKFFTLISLVMLSLAALAGTDNQPNIQNGGFEDWGVDKDAPASQAVEPRYWHSFTSAYGDFQSLAGDHCYKSTDAHSGEYCAMVVATKIEIFGIVLAIANGTMTTGRLKAGATDADDSENHAELDMSKTEEADRNGDPFYQTLEARPDSIVFWVKFSTGKAGTCANMSAFITDGTYYQAPAPKDKTYNNIVGKAENTNIAACSEWTRISVPFEYEDTNLEPKAIMLTFSTCATPGGGNGDEVLLVDDVELIYKSANEESGTSYTDDLVVKVNAAGEESSTTLPSSTINISQNTDGTYKLSIKNFALGPGMELGDVVADNLTGVTEGEYTTIKMNDVPVTIGNEMFAVAVGDLKINLDAKFTADKLYALIDLNVTLLNQVVNVIFGSPFTETGIDHVSVKNHFGINRVYEIGGQHVNRASVPGLYIINGKKVIKK
ncbi:MAG: hypothetical protein IJ891_05050 [Prevotella sp.]|nr:hypothetical protein [Prevotella sp.]